MCLTLSRLVNLSLAFTATGFLLLATSLTAGVNPPGYPPFPKGEYQPAGLGPKEPEIVVDFPGGAITRGIAKGNAVVSVMIGADGKATDYLVIGCSDLAFGKKLLDQAKAIDFQAARFKGVAVPARFQPRIYFRIQDHGHQSDGCRAPPDGRRDGGKAGLYGGRGEGSR